MRFPLGIRTSLITAIVTVAAAWLTSARPVQAVTIITSTVSTGVTRIDFALSTDVASTVAWCSPGYQIRKFYGTSNPTASCGSPLNIENGWIVEPGTSTTHSFPVLHLPPDTDVTINLHVVNAFNAGDTTTTAVSRRTLTKLAITSGPTVSGITTSQATIDWTTNRNADTQVSDTIFGPSWRLQRMGVETWNDVAVGNNRVAVAVGDGGSLMRTTNSGAIWATVSSVTASHLQGATAADALTFWAVGSGGDILLSDDGGVSWARISTGLATFFKDIAAVGPNRAIAVGASGSVFLTNDQGTSWVRVSTPVTPQLESIVALDANTWWIVGESGVILKTTNAGGSWDIQNPTGVSFSGIAAVNPSDALAATYTGEIWRTTDGGATWIQSTSGHPSLYEIVLGSDGRGWAFGDAGTVLTSPNGSSWSAVPVTSTNLLSAALVSPLSLWVVGWSGSVFNYGPDYGSGTTNLNSTLVTSHNHLLSPLAPCTQYFVRAASVDDPDLAVSTEPQNTVASLDLEFETDCPDPIPPTVTITNPNTGEIFPSAGITVIGTASDNIGVATVDVSLNGVLVGPASTANGFANWSRAVTLAAGTNTISVTARDAAGNVDTESVTVTFDNADPTLTLDPPNNTNRLVSSPSQTVSGTASDNLDLATVRVTQNGATVLDQTYPGGADLNVTWSTPALTLVNGANTIVATATDAAGRTASRTIVLTFDSGPPAVAVTSHASNDCVGNASVIFRGTASDPGSGIQSVEVDLNGGGFTPATVIAADWSITLTLTEGVNTLLVRATDKAGNTVTLPPFTLRHDGDDPVGQITSPTDGTITTSASLTVSGTASDPNSPPASYSCGLLGVEVSVNGGSYQTATGTSAWTHGVTLVSGANRLRARITDAAGRSFLTPEITVTLDTSVPVISITSPTDGATVATDPITVSGSASDNTSLREVRLTLNGIGQPAPSTTPALPAASVTWTASVGPLQPGNNVIVAIAEDNVNLTASATINVTYTPPDTTPPIISNAGVSRGVACPLNQPYLEFSWTTDEASNSQVDFSTNAGFIPTTTVVRDPAPPGVTNHVVRIQGSLLPNTTYYYRLTSTDAALNTSLSFEASVVTSDTCDTNPPTVTITTPSNGDTVSGLVTVEVVATDDREVRTFELGIDSVSQGGPISCGQTRCTQTYTWDTRAEPGPRTVTLEAQAEDTSGNNGTAQISVTIDNRAPVVSNVQAAPTPNPDGTWQAVITWCTDRAATSAVDYGLENVSDGSYSYTDRVVGVATPTVSGCNHSVRLDNLAVNQRYHYQVESCDARNLCDH